MIDYEYKLLTLLSRSKNGKLPAELLQLHDFENDASLSIALTELHDRHWIYSIDENDHQQRITGVGESELRKENIYRNSYRMSIATLVIAIVALILSAISLLASLQPLTPQILALFQQLLS